MSTRNSRKGGSSRKPKVIGTMVVDGKEIPVVEWLSPKLISKRATKARRREVKELEREWKEVLSEMNKGKGSLLEELLEMRKTLRGNGE